MRLLKDDLKKWIKDEYGNVLVQKASMLQLIKDLDEREVDISKRRRGTLITLEILVVDVVETRQSEESKGVVAYFYEQLCSETSDRNKTEYILNLHLYLHGMAAIRVALAFSHLAT
ncbi:hypothetical protein CsSME_00037706 [Camellia sinensis var. sinensis]